VEVNTADSAVLVALPGIGPAFAKGILKYRDRLGGYHRLDQLAEVYVLKDKPDAIARLNTLLVVDSMMVRKVPINTCSVEELAAHPYAGWKVAKPLIAYRDQHGPFSSVQDITACQAVGEDVFRKLAPYLTVE
jgi:competence ComEA-like helix-hairpin-helix protein